MGGLLWRCVLAVGVVASTIGGYALLTGDEAGPAAPVPTMAERNGEPATPETLHEGVVARLPFVGTLTWRCDDERRFSTQLVLPNPGATVFVSLTADGTRVWRHRQVDPVPAPKRSIAGPFRAARRQSWTIRYHHEPATLTVKARLRFAAWPSRGQCVVSRARVEVRRTPH